MRGAGRCQSGFTLIEVILAMVIISMAAITLIGVMSAVSERSASALQQAQSASVASAYLRQIMARPFPPAAGNIDTFNGLSHNGARDQFGNAITGLSGYQVNVTVAAAALGSIPSTQSRLITVRVTSPAQTITVLQGYRTDHP